MQVNAVNTNSFAGKRDNIDGFINLDDQTIRQLSVERAMIDNNPQKYKRTRNALTVALPVVAGIAEAVTAQKGAKMRAFAGAAGGWTAFLLGMGAVFGLEKFARNHSEKFRNFEEKHNIISFIASLTAAFFAGNYAIKGGIKAVKALKNTGAYKKVADVVVKLKDKAMANKHVAKVNDFIAKTVEKTPKKLKSIVKAIIPWGPIAVIFGSLAHSINYNNKVSRDISNNYYDLKERQIELARARNAELAYQVHE